MFKSHIYKNRRTSLASKVKKGIILFFANNEAPMNYPDNTYRYRQDSSFNYFYGHKLTGLVGLIDLDNQKDILFGNDLTMDDIIWMGVQPTIAELAEKSGITEVRPKDELKNYIQNIDIKDIHFLPTYRGDQTIELSRLLNCDIDTIESGSSLELTKAVIELRNIKEDVEIEEMDAVCDTGVLMHESIMKNCKPGKTEREMAGLAEGVALQYGVGTSFPVIVSQNGETLHNHDHSQILQEGRLLLVDMGAESINGYSSDYTRTIPVSGKFTEKQKAVYNIVLEANLATIEMAKPGILYWDVHLNALTILAKGLKKLDLIKGEPEKAAKEGAIALFQPHGLGHMLGMDCHDMEGFGEDLVGYDEEIQRSSIFGHASLRCGRRLKPGYIVSDEPGIYFIPDLIAKWEKENKFTEFINYDKVKEYIGFGGIRLEDDILITDEGCRVLGRPLAKTVEEIENIMSNN